MRAINIAPGPDRVEMGEREKDKTDRVHGALVVVICYCRASLVKLVEAQIMGALGAAGA